MCRHGVDGHDGGLLARLGVGSIAAGLAAMRDWLHLLHVVDARQRAGGRRITRRCERPFRFGFDPSEAGQPGHRRRRRGHAGQLPPAVGEPGDEDNSAFAFKAPDDQSEPSARSSFGERFAFDLASVPSRFSRPSQVAGSFDDRFIGEGFPPAPRFDPPRLRHPQQPRALRAPPPRALRGRSSRTEPSPHRSDHRKVGSSSPARPTPRFRSDTRRPTR